MKNRRHPNRSRLACLIALLIPTSAVAALIPTEWQYRQGLQVPKAGLVQVELTAATFDAAAAQLQDLRVLDPAGREVATLIDRPPTPVARTMRPKSFAVKIDGRTTVVTMTTGTEDELKAVVLETPHSYFLISALIELSDDQVEWTVVDRGALLFRQWGAEQLALDLARHRAAFVRISIEDRRDPTIPFTGARLEVAAAEAPTPIAVGARIARREEFAGETVLTVALDGRHVPLASLTFTTPEALFMRRTTVSVREVRDATSVEKTVGSGTIYRVALDGAPSRTQLELPLNFVPETRELLVHVHNGDSPPLIIDHLQTKRQPVTLRFMAPTAGTYLLLSGNAQVDAPHYDLATFVSEMRTADATIVIPEAPAATPGFRPRESIVSTPLPDVPLLGAPLDTSDWTWSRPITIGQPGVQELELDPAALAQSQRGYADVRVLRAGNQIPYVLEQPALARALTLTPESVPDPKHPTVSRWQLQLPHAGLPLRQVTLTSATPLFQRQVRIYEKFAGPDGDERENTLASGSWQRTPGTGVPENRTFELNDRPRTDTLWLESDNGDNPAIELGTVEAVYPVVRLVFKTAAIDGFTLVYGNKAANAPRYDLSLVAVKLLTASRNVARLDAPVQTGSKGNPFAGLNGGYVFWGALALVVIGLLVVVAKLLPKPPPAT